jgi:hypothetical protein
VIVSAELTLRRRRGLFVLVDRSARKRYSATEADDALALWLLASGVDVADDDVGMADLIAAARRAGIVLSELARPRGGGGAPVRFLATHAGSLTPRSVPTPTRMPRLRASRNRLSGS